MGVVPSWVKKVQSRVDLRYWVARLIRECFLLFKVAFCVSLWSPLGPFSYLSAHTLLVSLFPVFIYVSSISFFASIVLKFIFS